MQEQITLRHPHTGHTVEVDATEAEMIPFMVRGYQQVLAETTTGHVSDRVAEVEHNG